MVKKGVKVDDIEDVTIIEYSEIAMRVRYFLLHEDGKTENILQIAMVNAPGAEDGEEECESDIMPHIDAILAFKEKGLEHFIKMLQEQLEDLKALNNIHIN